MIAAASAFPLLLIAQLAHVYFQYDVTIAGAPIFVDRAIYVGSLGLYALWLNHTAPIAGWIGRTLAILVALSIWAVFLPRIYAMPVIWTLQVGLMIALALWAHEARSDGLRCAFVSAALLAQAIGALTIMPLCQFGAAPEWLALPQAQYVCSAVIGPVFAAFLPAGLGGVAWVAFMVAAIRRSAL